MHIRSGVDILYVTLCDQPGGSRIAAACARRVTSRYAVLVTLQYVNVPQDLIKGAVVYPHVNIVVRSPAAAEVLTVVHSHVQRAHHSSPSCSIRGSLPDR